MIQVKKTTVAAVRVATLILMATAAVPALAAPRTWTEAAAVRYCEGQGLLFAGFTYLGHLIKPYDWAGWDGMDTESLFPMCVTKEQLAFHFGW